jgi:hypothetical protein
MSDDIGASCVRAGRPGIHHEPAARRAGVRRSWLHVDGPARPAKDEYGDEDAKCERRHVDKEDIKAEGQGSGQAVAGSVAD